MSEPSRDNVIPFPRPALPHATRVQPARVQPDLPRLKHQQSAPTSEPMRGAEPARRAQPRSEPLLRDVIGDVLRDERHRQRRTLREVAKEAGVSVPYLSEIERGTKEASSEFVAVIGQALGLRLTDIATRAADSLRRSDGSNAVLLAA